jgi:hypothetical protein
MPLVRLVNVTFKWAPKAQREAAAVQGSLLDGTARKGRVLGMTKQQCSFPVLATFATKALDQSYESQQDEHTTDDIIEAVQRGERDGGAASGPASAGWVEESREDDEEPSKDHQARPPGTRRAHTAPFLLRWCSNCTVLHGSEFSHTMPAAWCTSSIVAGHSVGNVTIEHAHVADPSCSHCRHY